MTDPLLLAVATTGGLYAMARAYRRLQLSLAKHPSLLGHTRMAKRVARIIPGYAYDEAAFFGSDGAPADVVALRRQSFAALCAHYAAHYPQSAQYTAQAREALSDLQFTGAYRVPFQYSPYLRKHLKIGSFVRASTGVEVEDIDGDRFYDLTGSYGVNLLGYDFYKSCIAEGAARVAELGPVLGQYHPCVISNVQTLQRISGLDEVSFHMSGTEAVMQAVRLARYHTGRTHLVRFCGAYNGWWEDVQPGPGNPVAPRYTYTLREMSERTLTVLRTRRQDAGLGGLGVAQQGDALVRDAHGAGDGAGAVDVERHALECRDFGRAVIGDGDDQRAARGAFAGRGVHPGSHGKTQAQEPQRPGQPAGKLRPGGMHVDYFRWVHGRSGQPLGN